MKISGGRVVAKSAGFEIGNLYVLEGCEEIYLCCQVAEGFGSLVDVESGRYFADDQKNLNRNGWVDVTKFYEIRAVPVVPSNG